MFLSKFSGKKVLLLQGPVGPFFKYLAQDLEKQNAQVFKLNFNGGDDFFYSHGESFTGKMSGLDEFLRNYLHKNSIDSVFVFGDCRPIHKIAKKVVDDVCVEWLVFEEGYLRPNHITLEVGGVNGYSELPEKAVDFLSNKNKYFFSKYEDILEVGKTFWYATLWAILYYIFSNFKKRKYPNYVHHRSLQLKEGLYWLRGSYRKFLYKYKESHIQKLLENKLHKKYYLVPLQTHNDAQILFHSKYNNIEEFITEVMVSFAKNAVSDTYLVIKHHPFDRGYRDYTLFINSLSGQLNIKKRVMYIHDQYLPTVLTHALGVVVINSTVGMSAVETFLPVKVCGQAVYDLPNITVQNSLDVFWSICFKWQGDNEKIQKFLFFLTHTTQFNGSFYKRLDECSNHTGIIWNVKDSSLRFNELDLHQKL